MVSIILPPELTRLPPAVALWPALFGLGLYLILTGQPIGRPKPDLVERLRRLDVDERIRRQADPNDRRAFFVVPALEALLRPVLDDCGRLVQRLLGLVGLASGAELAHKLALTRPGVEPIQFYGEKVAAALIGAALFPFMTGLGIHPFGAWPVWSWVITGVLGFLAPDWELERRLSERRLRCLMELPTVLDLLTIACSAGLALEQALTIVARENRGIVAGEIQRAMREIALGQRTLPEALAAIGERNAVPELTGALGQLRTSSEQGVPLAQSLAAQADALREQKRLRIVADGGQASVRMVIPVALFVLPVLFAVLLFPAVEEFLHLAG